MTILLLGLGCASSGSPSVGNAAAWADRPLALAGHQAAQQYATQKLKDYQVVWALYDLDSSERSVFLYGLVGGLLQGNDRDRRAVHEVPQGAVDGNPFRTTLELGSKHASGTAMNEQVQGAIRSSLSVSEAVSLG